MSECNHSREEHEAFKQPGIWETLPLVGHQPGGPGHDDLEMRNAPCQSTLCKHCKLTEAQREEIRAAVRARNEYFRQQVDAAIARGCR